LDEDIPFHLMLNRLLPATRLDCNTLSFDFHAGDGSVPPGSSARGGSAFSREGLILP
jgi:hypothetical protein